MHTGIASLKFKYKKITNNFYDENEDNNILQTFIVRDWDQMIYSYYHGDKEIDTKKLMEDDLLIMKKFNNKDELTHHIKYKITKITRDEDFVYVNAIIERYEVKGVDIIAFMSGEILF